MQLKSPESALQPYSLSHIGVADFGNVFGDYLTLFDNWMSNAGGKMLI